LPEISDSSARAGIDRRTVLAGAAWSVPVVAVALAAPAAAASGWSVTVAFIAAELELRYRDFVVAAITISNTSTEDIVNEPATFSLTNFDTANEPDFTPSFPEDADVMTDTQNGTTDVDNQQFSATGPVNGTITVTSDGGLSIPAGSSLTFGLFFTREAENTHEAFYLIAGSFTIGDRSGSIGQTRVDLPPA
jgi:hypothetical protein